MEILPNDVNGYRFVKRLSEGTFGVTYLVENIKSRIRYAMKVPKDLLTEEARY